MKPRREISASATKHVSLVRPPWWTRDGFLGLALVVFTLTAYLPALSGTFVWDDDRWTTGIPRLLQGFSGLASMWSDPFALQQYFPLTGTTFWLDHQLWGFWSLPLHVENVLLHALAAILFCRLLRLLDVPGPWLAAALFALHPMMVESVAWITERKNVLSQVLFLGAFLAYGRFASGWNDDSTDGGPRRRGVYALALVLFAGALLAKSITLSFPAVLLLVCWWKRGRIRWKADVVPTLPFFALAVGMGLSTAWLEQHSTGAEELNFDLSLPERCLIAGRASWFYLGKLLWPANLCFVYPQWRPDAHSAGAWLWPAAAVAAIAGLWFARERLGRGPLAAVLYFLGTLSPLLGFVDGYGMRYSFVWDHWVYLSSLGIFALAAALIVRVTSRFSSTAAIYGTASLMLAVLAVMTWRQSGMYVDMETLWRTTIRRNPDCWMAYNNLGVCLSGKGDVRGAIGFYTKALEIQPDAPEVHVCLGTARFQLGEVDQALAHFQRALEIQPNLAMTHYNLGNALLSKGQVDKAIAAYRRSLELKPDLAEAEVNMASAYLQRKQPDEAIRHYRMALDIQPGFADAHFNLATILSQQGQLAEALVHYHKASELQPTDVQLLNTMAWMLATCPDASIRNGKEAVALAQRANQLSGGQVPEILQTLAAAQAETGAFPEALATAQQALQFADARNKPGLSNALREQIKLYQARSPMREASQAQMSPASTR